MMSLKNATLIGLFAYSLLSLTDLTLTWVLIEYGGGRVRESNPVAHAWLAGFGWHGLIWFKATTMFVVAMVVLVLIRHRPRTGLILVSFACMAVGSVVLYSYQMLNKVLG
jgi:hypothetical protein